MMSYSCRSIRWNSPQTRHTTGCCVSTRGCMDYSSMCPELYLPHPLSMSNRRSRVTALISSKFPVKPICHLRFSTILTPLLSFMNLRAWREIFPSSPSFCVVHVIEERSGCGVLTCTTHELSACFRPFDELFLRARTLISAI